MYIITFHLCNGNRTLQLAQHLKLKEIVDNKNHTEFFEDEKELLWKLRGEMKANYPESLSKLLLITKWNKHEDVAQVLLSPVRSAILSVKFQRIKIWKEKK